MTKPTKLIIFLFLFGFLFAVSSCKQEKKIKFQPRLPNAKNFNKEYKNDSCLFSISVKGDSILIADNDSSCFINDFSLIDSFVCCGLKSGRINPDKDYPIILYIDSLTPYPVVDRLIEELQLVGFNKFYFKTRENGFFCAFFESTNDDGIRDEIGKLYGSRFLLSRNLMNDCVNNDYWFEYLKPQSDEPPPPPPPPPPYLFGDDKLCMMPAYRSATVSMENGSYLLDGIKLSKVNLGLGISKKVVVFIKMNKDNTYNDFISILSIISRVNKLLLNHHSIIKYKNSFDELDKEQKHEIKRYYSICFCVLSLAYQNYIEKHKNDVRKVKFTPLKTNKKRK